MNEVWIKDSHKSAKFFKNKCFDSSENDRMRVTRILDTAGMFETSWLLFDHARSTKYEYGYPK